MAHPLDRNPHLVRPLSTPYCRYVVPDSSGNIPIRVPPPVTPLNIFMGGQRLRLYLCTPVSSTIDLAGARIWTYSTVDRSNRPLDPQ